MSNNLKSNMATSSSTEQNVLVLILDACGDFANSTTSTDPSQIVMYINQYINQYVNRFTVFTKIAHFQSMHGPCDNILELLSYYEGK